MAKKASTAIDKEQKEHGFAYTNSLHDYDDAIKGIGRNYFDLVREKEDIKDLDRVTKLMAPYVPAP